MSHYFVDGRLSVGPCQPRRWVLVAVETKIKKAAAELKATVLARRSHLMDIHGVGPVVAARILADVGDVARFADLRISHFPDPRTRRYNEPTGPGRPRPNDVSTTPVDKRGEPQ